MQRWHIQIEATDVSSNYSANRISVGNLKYIYWVMYSGLATTILCAKFLSSPIVHSEFLMGKKRVGRPRQNWLHYAKKRTFEHILGGYDYTETVAEDSRIYDAAFTRTF